jgi:hypothetical protein
VNFVDHEVKLSEDSVTRLVPTKSDADVAMELRDKLRAAYAAVCDVLNEADAAGLAIGATCERSPTGRFHPAFVKISVQKQFF